MGQAFSFVAMLFPLSFSSREAVVNLVASSAIALAVVNFATLALPMSYPSIADEVRAATALKAAAMFVLLVAAALCVVGILLALGHSPQPRLFAAAGLLTFMSADYAMVSWLVRSNNADGVTENRLKYGVTNLVVTAGVALLWRWEWSLIVSSCAVYVLSMAWVLHARSGAAMPVVRDAAKQPLSAVSRYTAANLGHAASYLIYGASAQAPNLIVYELGPAAALWAAVASVCGGFSTTATVIIAPQVDAGVATAVRSGRWHRVPRVLATGIVEGAVLAAIALPASLALSSHLGYFHGIGSSLAVEVVAAAVILWTTALTQQGLLRTMSLLGLRRTRMAWDATRFVFLAGVVILMRGADALLALAIVVAIWNVAYVTIIRLFVLRRHRRALPSLSGEQPPSE
jgi:hypothetical protein